MRQLLSLLGLVVMAAVSVTAQIPAKSDPWAGVRFLVGTWQAKTTGEIAQAQSTGTYSFRLELRGQVLARHSAGAADYNCDHRDLLYLCTEGPVQSLRAIYFAKRAT